MLLVQLARYQSRADGTFFGRTYVKMPQEIAIKKPCALNDSCLVLRLTSIAACVEPPLSGVQGAKLKRLVPLTL